MTKTSILGWLLNSLLCGLATAQFDSQAIKSLSYTARLGDREIGSETVTLRADGWVAVGKFDVLGTRKGSYTFTLTRHDQGYVLDSTSTSDGKEHVIRAEYDRSNLKSTLVDSGKSQTTKLDGPGKDVTFAYEDLLWASMIEAGRSLAQQDEQGTLVDGLALSALIGSACYELPVKHLASHNVTQTIGDQSVQMRISTIRLGPSVEVVLVCTRTGIPLRIEIPSQHIVVTAAGFEQIRNVPPEPTSIVDSGPWRQQLSQPEMEFDVHRKVLVPMRDGVHLAADIYVPKGKGPFPTVLARTPYSRASEAMLKGTFYAQRGYVFLAQDVRGRFDSEGEWFPFNHETDDGSDTLDWIAEQSWSNGHVGMVGASYGGLVQWLAAKSGNKHLTCIVPQVSPPDPHENFPYEGGAFIMGAAWWARVLEAMKLGEQWSQGVDWWKVYKTTPLNDLGTSLGLKEASFLKTWLAHPPHDREFWAPSSYQDMFGDIDLPAFHVSGWYDGDQPGALQNFVGMRRHAKTHGNDQYLVMGPWTHFFNSDRRIGDVDFGPEGTIDLDSRIVRFFDHYLKGIDNGIDKEDAVFVFTMGTNRWHGTSSWPLPGTRFTKLYLASEGGAQQRDGDGRLTLAATEHGVAKDSFRYDPTDFPKLDVDFTDLSGAQATEDKNKVADRTDDLEYTSPPLASDCEIVGPIETYLQVSTDAEDTDFVATLYHLTADGHRYLITTGIQRLRYAKDPRRDQPVSPGSVTQIRIDCWATGLRLRKNDRIQLEVSSWGWPSYARNLNTLDAQASSSRAVVATNTVFHDSERKSYVLLPVVARSDAPTLSFVQ